MIELAARAWIRLRRAYYVFSPRTRHELTLDAATHPQLPPRVRFFVNSDGERGDEFVPRPDTFRILVAGGSTTECYFLDQDDAWPSRVQAHLSTPGSLAILGAKHVHVGSIGSSGMHSGALSLVLRRVLPRYRSLDALILVVGVGDALRWFTEDTPENGQLRVSLDDYFARHPELSFGLTPRRTGIAEMSRRARDRWLQRVERRDQAGRWVGRARSRLAEAREVREETPDTRHLLANYERNLRAIIELSRQHASQVLVIRQPWFDKSAYSPEELALFWNGGVGEPGMEGVSVFYSPVALSGVFRQIDDCTGRIAEQCDVPCMELRPVVPSDSSHYYDQVHFSVAGSRAVAEAVAEQLLEVAGRPMGWREPFRVTPSSSARLRR
jgi:lysophospholipase L1-like esterase